MESLKHIQFLWTDISSITRCVVVTSELYKAEFKEKGISLSPSLLTVPYMRDEPLLDTPAGAVYLKPSGREPKPLPWLDNVGYVFGNFYEKNNSNSVYCPRSFLSVQQQKLKDEGLRMTIGFELEFYLLKKDGTPIDGSVFGQTRILQGTTWKVISEIVEVLQKLEIPVWRYHGESGPGQFEIAIGPFKDKPVDACDAWILAREAIFHTAAKYEFKATFLPKPFPNELGSSSHVHISLTDTIGNNALEKNKCFVGGIFEQIPFLMPILTPIGNSFERLQPGTWSGCYHCLGTENKEASIRLIKEGDKLERFEVKTPDSTSNPYLVIGSFIGAGLLGMKYEINLPPEINNNPAAFGNHLKRLPEDPQQSIVNFKKHKVNQMIFEQEFIDMIAKIRTKENDYWNSNSSETKMKLLFERF